VDRRTFMQLLSGAGVSAALGCGDDPITAVPTGWGQAPNAEAAALLAGMPHIEGVLEVYLMGGMNPWDTFYVVPEFNKNKRRMWWTFQEDVEEHFYGLCQAGSRPLLQPFGTASDGQTVNLGPWTYPLRERTDLTDRMRIITMQHAFEPHQVATPLMLCGTPRGTPRMAATPSHVQRFQSELDPLRTTPHSYVLFSEDTETQDEFNVQSAVASGLHPGAARPMSIRLLKDNQLPDQLTRTHLGGYANGTDNLVQAYLDQYKARLRVGPEGLFLPARVLQDMCTARRQLRHADQLASILTPELLAPIAGEECGGETDLDTPAMGMRLAANLLTRSQDRARYVTYIDSGIINSEAAGYDTHDNHVFESSRNIIHTLRKLAEIVNKPGENDPGKLDLNKHLILITTEFGRTPFEEDKRMGGLNHWPFGFAVAAIGGFVQTPGVVGAIAESAYATEAFTPQEFRAALLMSLGIWPFSREGHAIGDIRLPEGSGAGSEAQAAALLRQHLLGYPV